MLLGYVRVSSEDQAKADRTSLSEQERMIRAYAAFKGFGEFDVVIYRDPGVSGSMPLSERPGGAKLLDVVKPGDTVLAAKLDRLFRSTLDALTVAEDFKERGINLCFLDFHSGEPVTSDGMARCFFTILAAFATLERDRIRERMREGKKAKKAKGGHTGGLAPYGFQIIGEGRQSRLVTNLGEREDIEVIRYFFWQTTPAEACRTLTDLGIVDRAGSPFRPNQIKRIAERRV